MIDVRVIEVNQKIAEEIAKLEIADEANFWTVDARNIVKYLRNMDGKTQLCEEDFFVRDDSFDVQYGHIVSEFKPYKPVTMANKLKVSYEVDIDLVCVTIKKNARNIIMKAFENIGGITLRGVETNTKDVLERYFIIDAKHWGQNPNYEAFVVKYSVFLPSLKVDYADFN